AEKVKHEVQVIWSDYFKPEHLAAFPDLHTKVWNLLKLAGRNKQGRRAGSGRSRGRHQGVCRHVLGDQEVADDGRPGRERQQTPMISTLPPTAISPSSAAMPVLAATSASAVESDAELSTVDDN
ncbi:MAG: hypothetical protein MUQ32_05985, partial [Chloroflexi bacterium]|nr:hypothetical protein [Chloroflexota bacterium]